MCLLAVKPVGGEGSTSECFTMQTFGLAEFSGVLARHLSGGNKRKLCVAIAFLAPQVILLDEPTAGEPTLEPRSRRPPGPVFPCSAMVLARLVDP